MIHLDGPDDKAAPVIDHALGIFMRDDAHMLGVDLVVGNADIAVWTRGNPGSFGNALDPRRAVHMQRTVPPPEFLPDGTCHGHVEQAGIVVGMVVRKENPVDMPDAEAKLRKPDHGAAATVDENAFLTSLDQCRGTKGVDLRIGYAGAEKRHAKNIICRWKPCHLLFPDLISAATTPWNISCDKTEWTAHSSCRDLRALHAQT